MVNFLVYTMRFEFNFYSSLLLITFSQGIIYCFLFLKKGHQTREHSNFWIASFILLCSLYIAPWMLGFAGWYDNQPYRDFLFYFPFQHLFLFGPVIYFYTQSLLNTCFKVNKRLSVHFLPGILFAMYNIVIWVYDRFIFKGYYFYADGVDKDFDIWYQYSGLASMIIYFGLSIRYYNFYRRFIFQVTSFAESILFRWIKTYLIAFLILMLLPVAFDCLGLLFPELVTYKGSWWFFLAYSLVMYYLAITAYSNPIVSRIGFRFQLFEAESKYLLVSDKSISEEMVEINSKIDDRSIDEILEWKNKIVEVITNQELYKNPNLTLSELSKRLDLTPNMVSKVINAGFKMNFNDLINHYRVEEVKRSFRNRHHSRLTILAIAYDSGFNSKATFNRAFKKNTGMNPKDYLNSLAQHA